VPEDGHRNSDGYVRVLDRPRKDGGRLVMLHRLEWEKINGPIPEGHEVNHKCKNRECCNVNHLEVLSRSEHKSLDNAKRYKGREDSIVAFFMKSDGVPMKCLSSVTGLHANSLRKMINRRVTNLE
jgi:hypothetical protein